MAFVEAAARFIRVSQLVFMPLARIAFWPPYPSIFATTARARAHAPLVRLVPTLLKAGSVPPLELVLSLSLTIDVERLMRSGLGFVVSGINSLLPPLNHLRFRVLTCTEILLCRKTRLKPQQINICICQK